MGVNPAMVDDKTDFISKPESKVWSVSVRGWLALIIVGSACFAACSVILAAVSVAIYKGSFVGLGETAITTMFSGLKDLGLIAIGYYFAKDEREHFGRSRKPTDEAKFPKV